MMNDGNNGRGQKMVKVDAKIFYEKNGTATINVKAHPATFKKLRKEIEESWVTVSAAKYCDIRRAFGVYVIAGPTDAVEEIFSAHFRF